MRVLRRTLLLASLPENGDDIGVAVPDLPPLWERPVFLVQAVSRGAPREDWSPWRAICKVLLQLPTLGRAEHSRKAAGEGGGGGGGYSGMGYMYMYICIIILSSTFQWGVMRA